MCNTLLVSKAWLLFFFPFFFFFFRARQACNQMQFIYRNDTTSTDHDKVSSLVWDKTPFMVSLKGWIQWCGLVALVKKGKCRFGLLRPKGIQYVVKGTNPWHFTTGQIKDYVFIYSLNLWSSNKTTLSPLKYARYATTSQCVFQVQCIKMSWGTRTSVGVDVRVDGGRSFRWRIVSLIVLGRVVLFASP